MSAQSQSAESPLEGVLNAERRHLLGRIVSDLPRVLRMIVFLHYFDDRPLDEIAETLELPVARIAVLHRDALLQVRRAWAR